MMQLGYTPDVADACKMLQAAINHLEKSTIESRLANIRLARKFNRLKNAAEEWTQAIRRF